MTNEDLIQSLMADYAPVPRHVLARRMTLGLASGFAVALAVVLGKLGLRPDLPQAVETFPFWVKWIYVAMLAAVTIAAAARLAHPEVRKAGVLWLAALPFAGIAILAAIQTRQAGPEGWSMLWMGKSWAQCPVIITILAIPLLAGGLWALRGFAPSRKRLAGFVTGAGAGALAAFAYALHCVEVSAVFIGLWYTLGVAIPALFGILLGPIVLRW
ncbi:DUF1109 domain-containing protein [Novosphingobium beihaiensis]|uniref:DUF1109 domain-containing protein n=1 Tax=Novosphingobium beihaiensis TaxID=2930389 RepID=A0ABT0BLT1_9SPHN|nr:DUF1109 domain-containing protein [Novosphingobium beihaiensis]MCJ2185808.1 DUF1109 domain-containing protein [Novosphingobium beihaiensis]